MLERWTRAVVHYRAVVIAAWALVVLLGLFSGSHLTGLLSTSLAVPGTDSARADLILQRHFGENVEGTFTIVLPFMKGSPTQVKRWEAQISAAVQSVPTAHVIAEKAVAGVLYANIGTSLDLIHASAQTGALRSELEAQHLGGALVTGPPAIEHDLTPVLAGDLRRGEVLALMLALALLVLVLGLCGALLVPFLVAGATVAGAIAIVYLLAHHLLMVLYVPNVVELVALGLAIDYSLLIVHRFRRETEAEGTNATDAVVSTMASAGRTIVLSAFTVALGLAALLLVPVPFVRSLGAAGLVVPLVALTATLTLLPALLSLLGRRGVRPLGRAGLLGRTNVLEGPWYRVAGGVLKRPLAVLVSCVAVLVPLASSALWLQLTPGSVVAVPPGLESIRAISVANRIGPGLITPNEVVVDLGRAHLANTSAMTAARLSLAEAILHDKEVFAVAIDTRSPFVDTTGRFEQLFVFGRNEFGAGATQQLVERLRQRFIPASTFPSVTRIYLGGPAAQGVDFLHSVYGAFWWLVLLTLALAYLVLLRAFRSVLLAAIAVLLDLLSVAVSYGLVVIVFRSGLGSAVLGTYRVDQIEGWVPIVLFAMLFGLSMDYEVFIVMRMRESWLSGASSARAITDGLAQTGGVVSAAAVIMMGALAGLVFGHVAGLQELGVGLALGVLVDASVVRGLLLPSLMALLGPWSWWMPGTRSGPAESPVSQDRGTGLSAGAGPT